MLLPLHLNSQRQKIIGDDGIDVSLRAKRDDEEVVILLASIMTNLTNNKER